MLFATVIITALALLAPSPGVASPPPPDHPALVPAEEGHHSPLLRRGIEDGGDYRKLQDDNVDPAVCDRIENSVCIIETSFEWSLDEKVSINPNTILHGTGGPPSDPVTGINLAEGASLSCRKRFCELEISGFDMVVIDGTLRGSRITVRSLGDIKMDSASSFIDTNGMGYGGGLASGPGVGTFTRVKWKYNCADYVYIGAGHGGNPGCDVGSTSCACEKTEKRYDEEATDFGSGGSYCSSHHDESMKGGGAILLDAENTITFSVGAHLSANTNQEGLCRPYCSGASGGSIRIVAASVLGAGTFTANGGGGWTGGGGGRIKVIADDFAKDNFDIQVKGGGSTVDCAEAVGQDGTVNTGTCKTSICFNGGKLLQYPQCQCECEEPWRGRDCASCSRTCTNGGRLNENTCTCECQPGFSGDRCENCDSNYWCGQYGTCEVSGSSGTAATCTCSDHWFGSSCDQYCRRETTCSSNGNCSSDGSCDCNEDKAGKNCSCDKCLEGVPNACSGNGDCANDGVCRCGPGWTGCNCDIPCDCSGRGTCNGDGTCNCDGGFAGPNCSLECSDCGGNGQCNPIDGTCDCDEGYIGQNCMQDPAFFCAEHDCLPGVMSFLGDGWNQLTGERTGRIIDFSFNERKPFIFQGKQYFIPDQVRAQEVLEKTSTTEISEMSNTRELREYLSASTGASGGSKLGEMSLNAEYEKLVQRSFRMNRKLMELKIKYPLYEISFDDWFLDPTLSDGSILINATTSANQRVERLGSHYVKRVIMGGELTIRFFIDAQIYTAFTSTSIQSQLDGEFMVMAASGEAQGTYELTTEDGRVCSNTQLKFERIVNGGEARELILPFVPAKVDDFVDWIDSLKENPAPIEIHVDPMTYLFENMEAEIASYLGDVEIVEDFVGESKEQLVCKPSRAYRTSSSCAAAAIAFGTLYFI